MIKKRLWHWWIFMSAYKGAGPAGTMQERAVKVEKYRIHFSRERKKKEKKRGIDEYSCRIMKGRCQRAAPSEPSAPVARRTPLCAVGAPAALQSRTAGELIRRDGVSPQLHGRPPSNLTGPSLQPETAGSDQIPPSSFDAPFPWPFQLLFLPFFLNFFSVFLSHFRSA